MLASLTTFIMLYYRLPDSIRSGCVAPLMTRTPRARRNSSVRRAAAMASSASAAMISPSSASELETTDNEDGEKTTRTHFLSARRTVAEVEQGGPRNDQRLPKGFPISTRRGTTIGSLSTTPTTKTTGCPGAVAGLECRIMGNVRSLDTWLVEA